MPLNKRVLLAVCLSFVIALPAWAADVERLHTEQSVQVNAPADKVWAVVGKFEGLHEWHPAVKSTIMRNPVTRILDLGAGALLTEELESKADSQMMLNYRISHMTTVGTIQVNGKPIEKKALPVNTYSSTIRVKPAGTGSEVTWAADFHAAWLETSPAPAGMGNQDAINTMNEVFKAGLNNLVKTLGSATAAPTATAPQAPAAPAQSTPAPVVAPQNATTSASQVAAAPTTVSVSPATGKPYEGHVKCEGGVCKIDTFMVKGFRTFGQCQVCHGIDGGGSTIAPSLLVKLQQIDHSTFVDRVTNGYTGQIGVMPNWKDNPNIMNNIDNLYAYLKARSDAVIPAGNLERF